MQGKKVMKWPIVVISETYLTNGRKIKMNKTVDAGGEDIDSVEDAMLFALHSRKDGGIPFIGCEIVAETSLGQTIKRVYDPNTRRLLR